MSDRKHTPMGKRTYFSSNDMLESLAARFVFAPDGCWLWTGHIKPSGYGSVYACGKSHRAHRAMYELMVGPIPKGLELDHLCRVTHCVNPAHLEAVTSLENKMRSPRTGTDTHCIRGHEFTPENTRIGGRGVRRCRHCDRDSARARYHRKPRPVSLEAVSPLKEKATSGG